MEYRNFDLLIEPKVNECYKVSLPHAGVEDCLCDNIFSAEMKSILEELEKSVSDDLTPENLMSSVAEGVVDVEQLKKFGGALYECLFRQNIRDAFMEAYGEVRNDDDLSLRIRLIIEPPEIAQLPWELMYDKKQDLFLCTSDKTSITRFLQVPNTPRSLTVKLPLRILVAIPLNKKGDDSELETAAERKIVADAFKDLTQRKLVELDFLDPPVTISAINAKLDEKDYHVFHFIGHGCFEGDEGHLRINPDDSNGSDLSDFQKEGWIRADSFANLFTNCHSMKLVVLNSCQGAKISSTKPLAGLAPRLLRRNIPAVVAMQYPIFDDSALIFSREFYRKLCRGRESGLLDPAVINARNMILIQRNNGLDFATPVLLMRTSSGVIFDLKEDDDALPPVLPINIGPGPAVIDLVGTASLAHWLRGIGRWMVSRIRTLDEAPRLKAVGEARAENLALLQKEKDQQLDPSGLFDADIEHEEQELALIKRRLQTAARTSFRFTAIAMALGLIMLVAAVFGVFNVVDDWLQQRVWSATRSAAAAGPFGNNQVRVILVDPNEQPVEGFPTGTPADRAFHTKLIDALTDAGARVVALDINFTANTEADAAFAAAVNRAYDRGTQVIVGVSEVEPNGLPKHDFPSRLQDTLKDRWGNTNVGLSYEIGPINRTGPHSVLRHIELGTKITEGTTASPDGASPIVPSLVLKSLMQFDSSRGPATVLFYENPSRIRLLTRNETTRDIPVADDEMSFMITPAADDAIASVRRSYQDVLLHLNDREALARDYNGKIVLVGYGVETDRHFISWKRQRYGVEIQANAISNILQGVYAMKVPWRYNFLIFLLMGLAGYGLQSRYAQKLSISIFDSPTLNRMLKIPVALLLVTVLYFVVIYIVYRNSVYVVDMTYHILTLIIAYWISGLLKTRKKTARAKEYHLVNAT